MPHFRHRRRLRRKEIENLADALENALGCKVFSIGDTVDTAEGGEYDIILVDGAILGMMIEGTPFLTVRGLLKYEPSKRYVTVDMGAVSFVCNGADVMSPGIVEADPAIDEGDLVWIRDEKNMKPLAIGMALVKGTDMAGGGKGKAVKSIHYVGDKLWTFED
jgi:PUA domain protein